MAAPRASPDASVSRRGRGEARPQGRNHLFHGGIAAGGRLGHHFVEHLVHGVGHLGPRRPQGGNRLRAMGQHLLHAPLRLVGRPPDEEHVQRAAEAVDVGAAVDAAAVHRLLGRHEFVGADDLALHGKIVFHARFAGRAARLDVGQREAHDLDHALAVDQEVAGLDVPMADSLVVDGGQARGRLDRVLRGLRRLPAGPSCP